MATLRAKTKIYLDSDATEEVLMTPVTNKIVSAACAVAACDGFDEKERTELAELVHAVEEAIAP